MGKHWTWRMRIPEPLTPGSIRLSPGLLRALFVGVSVTWMAAALLFAALAEDSVARSPVALAAYWATAIFALLAICNAILRTEGNGRIFWALLGGGLIFRFVADMSREGFLLFDLLTPLFGTNDVAYAASYLLLCCAFVWLVYRTTSRITLLAALDSLCVVLSSNVLIWYFLLGPATTKVGMEGPLVALGVFGLPPG